MTRNIFHWEIFLQTKFKLLVTNYFITESQFCCSESKETQLKEGDRNTGFFHRTTNAHRRRNCVKSISINGKKLEKEAEIKDGLVAAFQNLFSAPVRWSPSLPNMAINEIGSKEAARLEECFSKEEIWTAISGL